MSQEDVEIVRRAYEHFNRTHAPAYELFDPNVEWHTAADLPDTGTHRGHSGVAALFSAWAGSFDDFRADVEELVDAGDHVVVWCTLRGRVRDSGAMVELPEAHVWKFRGANVVEVREYRTRGEALEAAGLRG
jgi:ketosteroid isomerase-like protein